MLSQSGFCFLRRILLLLKLKGRHFSIDSTPVLSIGIKCVSCHVDKEVFDVYFFIVPECASVYSLCKFI